jgi:hypothetical protein
MASTVLLKGGRSKMITVYVPKVTILKEKAAKIELSQHFFFGLVWDLSHTTSYID